MQPVHQLIQKKH